MKQTPFYKVLQETLPHGECMLATLVDGADAGQQFLLSGEKVVWQTGTKKLDPVALYALRNQTATGFLELSGTKAFAERFGAAPQIVVCGGGHVGLAVVRLAKFLGLQVLALEDRPQYALPMQQAGADEVIDQPFEWALQRVPGGTETYFVVVTRAHSYDVACLEQILRKPAAYVGMMGSRGRSALVRRQLLDAGLDAERVEALHAPIGLSIGSQSAEEIAVSILAELIQVKNSRRQSEGFVSVILDAMEKNAAQNIPAVLATITARHGSVPREVGTKMLISAENQVIGSVGGGIMEYHVILAAKEMLAGKKPALQILHFAADGTNDDAAIAACGGSMEVLLQLLPAEEENNG